MSSSKRHFTAVVGSKEHGLYNSSRGNLEFPLTPPPLFLGII